MLYDMPMHRGEGLVRFGHKNTSAVDSARAVTDTTETRWRERTSADSQEIVE